MFKKFKKLRNSQRTLKRWHTTYKTECPRAHLAAEIIVGNVQSEERLQAWRFRVTVL